MTGSTVLVDDDLCERFLEAARNWVNEKELTIEFEAVPFERAGYMVGNYDAERVAIGPLGGGVSGEGIALGEPAQSVGNAAPMPWAQYRLTASGLETVIANAPVGH